MPFCDLFQYLKLIKNNTIPISIFKFQLIIQNYVKLFLQSYHINVLVVCFMLWGCATPSSPTGGPADRTGPIIKETNPKTGTTNFGERTFEFDFTEFLNRASFEKSITVEPDLGLEYSVKWKRKKAIIKFKEPLPDSTTVIVTIGADVSDTKNNKMGVPKTVAVSTGDEIDKGSIFGKIRSAFNGKPVAGQKILLFREPIDFDGKAVYEAGTDTAGIFIFSYLREGEYQALLVDDRNRDKKWDKEREWAQPFQKQVISLAKAGADTLDVIYLAKQDTLAPKLQAIGLLSGHRMRLRFNEDIVLSDSVEISVMDSTGGKYTSAYPLYIPDKNPFVVLAQSQDPLIEGKSYSLKLNGIEDLTGNKAIIDTLTFTGSSQPDTTLQKFISSNAEKGLFQNQHVEVVYAAPITEPEIIDSMIVIEGDVTFEDWPAVYTSGNRLIIPPQDEWIEGVAYQFMIWNPETMHRKLLKPDFWDAVDMGGIDISITDDSTSVYNFKLQSPNKDIVIDSVFTESITIQKLPPVKFQLKVFLDENGNGQWDYGSIIPFIKPEPYYVHEAVTVRKGFTSEINIAFN